MLTYTDMYELLRKEKYSETLQVLPKAFVSDFSEYLVTIREESSHEDTLFLDNIAKSKKQLENCVAMFRELIRLRKKKILTLVFVATETGMMKRDYENMLDFEKSTFDKLVKAYEEGDKELTRVLNGRQQDHEEKHKVILFKEDTENFVDMTGNVVGPFKAGELANLESDVSQILVSSGKASFVDE
ncbi:hypothetical protein KW805_02480 [Candidatus Pacearchaeota archaeon]|nr:hypothetical protein [Candidatus Pacearchaeota archaeon]